MYGSVRVRRQASPRARPAASVKALVELGFPVCQLPTQPVYCTGYGCTSEEFNAKIRTGEREREKRILAEVESHSKISSDPGINQLLGQ